MEARSLTPDSPPPPGAMWMASVSRVSLEPCGQFQAAWPKWVREVPKRAGLAWVIPSINGRAWHPSKKNTMESGTGWSWFKSQFYCLS